MKRLRIYWPGVLVLCLAAAVPLLRLHFFHTPSAPIGLWRADPGSTPRVGDVVQFCMRSAEARRTAGRPYAGGSGGGPCPHDTWALAKPMAAGPGDTVVHTWAAVAVNGRVLPMSATRVRDSRGIDVPVAPIGTFVLGPGEFWMHSPYADASFDSRYLGVIGMDQVRGTLRPLVTWLTRSQRGALRARGVEPLRCGLVACPLPVTR